MTVSTRGAANAVVLLALMHGIAGAQPADPAKTREMLERQAGAEFSRADELREQGRCDQAMPVYARLMPVATLLNVKPFVCWGISQCQGDLKQYAAQLKTLDACVKTPGREGPNLDDARQKMRAKIIVLQRRLFGELRVNCAHPNVKLRLNSTETLVDCPHRWRRLEADDYALTAYFENRPYPAYLARVSVGKIAEHTVAGPGQLKLSLKPADATVKLDGRLWTPPHAVWLPPGGHALAISAPGMQTLDRTIGVDSNATHALQAALRPAPEAVSDWLYAGAIVLGVGAAASFGLAQYYDGEADSAYTKYKGLDSPTTAALDRAEQRVADHESSALTSQWLSAGLLGGALLSLGIGWWLDTGDEGSTLKTAIAPGQWGVIGRW